MQTKVNVRISCMKAKMKDVTDLHWHDKEDKAAANQKQGLGSSSFPLAKEFLGGINCN